MDAEAWVYFNGQGGGLRMSQLFCLAHLFDHLACVGIKSKKFFAQTVNESRKCPSIGDGFFFGNIQIVVITVNSFITCKSTSISKLSHARAKSETFDLLEQFVSGATGFNNQLFQTSPEQCAGSSWRKVCDALCFTEDIGNCFWHVFGRLNTGAIWENHLTVFPQSDFSAMCAYLNKVFIRLEKLKEISRDCVVILTMQPSRNPKGFTAFVSLWNRLIEKLTVVPAMRTSERE